MKQPASSEASQEQPKAVCRTLTPGDETAIASLSGYQQAVKPKGTHKKFTTKAEKATKEEISHENTVLRAP
jgi:hypothetical protein